jgi:hypothetical protein
MRGFVLGQPGAELPNRRAQQRHADLWDGCSTPTSTGGTGKQPLGAPHEFVGETGLLGPVMRIAAPMEAYAAAGVTTLNVMLAGDDRQPRRHHVGRPWVRQGGPLRHRTLGRAVDALELTGVGE